MKKLTTRQAGLLIFIAIISNKLVTYPALYAEYAGRDGYLAVGINMLFDLLLIAAILYISKKNPDKSFNEIIIGFFGVAITRVLNLIMCLIFIFKACYIIKSYDNYLLEVLFSYLPEATYTVPLFLLFAFIMSKSLRTLGRASEIFIFLILGGLIVTLITPIKSIEPLNLLPILENGLEPVLTSMFHCAFSVGDIFIVFILLGSFKLERNSHKALFKYSVAAAVFVFAFYFVFYSVFGIMAINESLAIADLPLFVSFPASVGRIDWITINLWTITLISQAGFLLSCALESFNYGFKIKGKNFSILMVLIITYVFSYVVTFNLSKTIEILTSPIFANISIVFQVLFPVLFLIAGGFKRKKNDEFTKKVFSK